MTSYINMSDAQLFLMVCNANHEAFAALVGRHTQKFFALAFRSLGNQHDAEDIVQNAFIKLWQKPDSWNPDKSLFTTWFYRVVLNACHDHLRRNKRWVQLEPQALENQLSQTSSEQSILEAAQELKLQQYYLEVGLSKLTTAQFDAINLVVYCELPQKQAAAIMGVSLKALESLLVRAKSALYKSVSQLRRVNMSQARDRQTSRMSARQSNLN